MLANYVCWYVFKGRINNAVEVQPSNLVQLRKPDMV